MSLSKEGRQEIVEKLRDRGASLPCPRCGNTHFQLLDGYFNQPLQPAFDGLYLGGTSIPSVVIACDRCGFLSSHALGALGLLTEHLPGTEK